MGIMTFLQHMQSFLPQNEPFGDMIAWCAWLIWSHTSLDVEAKDDVKNVTQSSDRKRYPSLTAAPHLDDAQGVFLVPLQTS